MDIDIPRRRDFLRRAGTVGLGALAASAGIDLARPAPAAADQPLPWLNVKDFGARGDGATNDRPAIQAAIDAIGEENSGQVYVPDGTYVIGSTTDRQGLRIGNPGKKDGYNNHLMGQSFRTRLKLGDGVNNGVHVISTQGLDTSYGRISNLLVDGNRSNNPGAGDGINFGSQSAFLHRVWATECAQSGIHLTGGYEVHLSDCHSVTNTLHGLYLQGSNDMTIDNVWINSCGGHGVYLLGGAQVAMTGLQIEESGQRGVTLDFAWAVRIVGCSVAGSRKGGIVVWNGTGIQIEASYFAANSRNNAGAYPVVGIGNNTRSSQVTGCVFMPGNSGEQEYAGVHVDHTTSENADVTIIGNTFSAAASWATSAVTQSGSTTNNVTIRHNTGRRTENSGLATIPNGSTNVTVTHGLAVKPPLHAISLTRANMPSDAGQFWVSDVTGSSFRINSLNPGTGDALFAWQATVL